MEGEAELVEQLRAGDEAAFVTLVRHYQPRLLRLAETLVGSRAVAEEVVQETWLGVVRGVDRFEARSSLKTWLFHILVNRARSAGGREQRAGRPEPADDIGARFDATGAWSTPPIPWAERVDDLVVAQRLAERVRDILPQLPDTQRQVLVLRDVEGLASDEVATMLGITGGNQRVLLHRGRARERELLEAELRS